MNQTTLREIETNDETLDNVIVRSERELRQFSNAVPDNSNIRHLDIGGFAMNADVATAFSAILQRMPLLESFDIFRCDCSNVDVLSILVSTLADTDSLVSLWLRRCLIGNQGAEIIAASFSNNSTLKSLHLEGNSIGDAGAIVLASLLSNNSSIRDVDLTYNSIGAEGMSALAASIGANYSVNSIRLVGNIDEPNTRFNRALYNDASIKSVVSSNHTLKYLHPVNNEDLRQLIHLNRAGPEKSMRAKIIRFLNEQPTYAISIGLEGNVMPSYMEKIGRNCRLNTMFELIHNMAGLFEGRKRPPCRLPRKRSNS